MWLQRYKLSLVQSGCDGLGWIVTPFFKYPDYWGIDKADLQIPVLLILYL